MSVTYSLLDKNKKELHKRDNAACFSSVNYEVKEHPGVIYLQYKLKYFDDTQRKLWVAFLKTLNIGYIPPFNKTTNSYTFNLNKYTGFTLFTLLTLIRYLEEEESIIRMVLKNINNKQVTPMQLLLISHIYTNNSNHTITMVWKDINEIVDFTPIYPESVPAIKQPIDRRLHATFCKPGQGAWSRQYSNIERFLPDYGLMV